MVIGINNKNNTGSCRKLSEYLDKETKGRFINNEAGKIYRKETVISEIDKYSKGQLGKKDTKFYELEYNPSQKEQKIIIEKATGKKDISNYNQLSQLEMILVKGAFSDFIRDAQTEQAKNYNRENLKNADDLKWYAKIELQRKYKGTDEEVKKGLVKSGTLKEGLQMHSHIIQSRKSMDKKMKLSPNSNYKKSSSKNQVKQGFDRNEFRNRVEKIFDKIFEHNRKVEDTFEYLMQKSTIE